MKMFKKFLLLLSAACLPLMACDLEKKCECLISSNSFEYNINQCYQVNRANVVESLYIINPPINPEASESEYKYDIRWNDTIRIDNFSFIDGLAGKKINSMVRVSDTVMKVTFDGQCTNQEATSGYLRVSPSAFKGLSERATDAFLYCYVAIGNSSGMVTKP